MHSRPQTQLVGVQALGAMCRSFLGPASTVKAVIHDPGHEHRNCLVASTAEFLHAVSGEPTATTLLLECLEAQERAVGCGGTWLVVLAGLLIGSLQQLQQQGAPTALLLHGMSMAMDVCQQVAHAVALPLHTVVASMPAEALQREWGLISSLLLSTAQCSPHSKPPAPAGTCGGQAHNPPQCHAGHTDAVGAGSQQGEEDEFDWFLGAEAGSQDDTSSSNAPPLISEVSQRLDGSGGAQGRTPPPTQALLLAGLSLALAHGQPAPTRLAAAAFTQMLGALTPATYASPQSAIACAPHALHTSGTVADRGQQQWAGVGSTPWPSAHFLLPEPAPHTAAPPAPASCSLADLQRAPASAHSLHQAAAQLQSLCCGEVAVGDGASWERHVLLLEQLGVAWGSAGDQPIAGTVLQGVCLAVGVGGSGGQDTLQRLGELLLSRDSVRVLVLEQGLGVMSPCSGQGPGTQPPAWLPAGGGGLHPRRVRQGNPQMAGLGGQVFAQGAGRGPFQGASPEEQGGLDAAAQQVLAVLRPLGVQLVLACSQLDPALVARIRELEGTVLMGGVPSRQARAVAAMCGVLPAPGLAGAQASTHVAPLRAALWEGGLPLQEEVQARQSNSARAAGATAQQLLVLQCALKAAPRLDSSGHSQGQRPCGAVPVTLVTRAPTSAAVQGQSHALRSSFRRTQATLAAGSVLPGGGVFELQCVAALRLAVRQQVTSVADVSGATGAAPLTAQAALQGLNASLAADAGTWAAEVLGGVADVLEQLVLVVIQSQGTRVSEAYEQLARAQALLSTWPPDCALPPALVLSAQRVLSGDSGQAHVEGEEAGQVIVCDALHARLQALSACHALVQLLFGVDRQIFNVN